MLKRVSHKKFHSTVIKSVWGQNRTNSLIQQNLRSYLDCCKFSSEQQQKIQDRAILDTPIPIPVIVTTRINFVFYFMLVKYPTHLFCKSNAILRAKTSFPLI